MIIKSIKIDTYDKKVHIALYIHYKRFYITINYMKNMKNM